MADTIFELYEKFVDGMGQSMEDDRYFRYLFEMVQASNTTFEQKNVVLKKVVDEAWISVIEDSIDAINNIVEKPRRFIKRSEEVVPVDLAKKITADSVRHLSMNTQFIDPSDDGEIHPSRVLNVTAEETYDLYENRFIYHLIKRLMMFVDKRTDLIFWQTPNETMSSLVMKSKVDDAYEEIEYELKMNIKNKQNFMENDADNMQVFMRIDRVRRLVIALYQSSFCEIMDGCQKVKNPIQRTNLMLKDPDYRKCYALWQFLDQYDEVGYIIEAEATAMEFDEDYVISMYMNLINNYTVFKSIAEDETRNLDVPNPNPKNEDDEDYVDYSVARKKVKPKFIKEIKEVIVDDYDIPDVEIRQVIIEEVTQAQLDAEAALAEEKILRQKAEEAEAEAQIQIQKTYQQLNEAMEHSMALEADLQKEIAAREEAEAETVRVYRETKENIEKVKAEADERVEKINAEKEEYIEQMKADMIAEIERIQAECEERINYVAEKAEAERDAAVAKAQADRDAAVAKAEADRDDTVARALADKEEGIALAVAEKNAAVAKAEADRDDAIAKAEADRDDTVARVVADKNNSVAKAEAERDAAITKAEADKRDAIADADARKAEAAATMAEAVEMKKNAEELSGQSKAAIEKAAKDVAEANAERDEALDKYKKAKETARKAKEDKEAAEAEKEEAEIAKAAAEKSAKQTEAESIKAVKAAEKLRDEAVKAKVRAEKAKAKAEKKAEGTRLSRFVIASLTKKDEIEDADNNEED